MSPSNDELTYAPARCIDLVRDKSGDPLRIGHGGNRGSSVYLVRCEGVPRALKVCALGASERAFCAAAQGGAVVKNGVPIAEETALAAPLYIVRLDAFRSRDDMSAVTPAAIHHRDLARAEDENAVPLGIVMPLYDCSLHRLLTAPSIDVACHPRDTPLTPASPCGAGTITGCQSLESFAGLEAASTSSSDAGDATEVAFHMQPRQRRVGSLVVLAALLEAVARGLCHLHTKLIHRVPDAKSLGKRTEYRGFAHQDLRSDNVLVSRSGAVVVCDFELVAHVGGPCGAVCQAVMSSSCDDSGSENYNASCESSSRRMLPAAFHAPEGPNAPKGDSWLLGLLGVELFTGITPFIKASVAFDDFGDGPYLSVDPDNGIGWAAMRRHIHARVRPFPSDEETTTSRAAGYMDPIIADYCARHSRDPFAELHEFSTLFENFLAACLSNDPADRAAPHELVQQPLFRKLREITEDDPRSVVQSWVSAVGRSSGASPVRPEP